MAIFTFDPHAGNDGVISGAGGTITTLGANFTTDGGTTNVAFTAGGNINFLTGGVVTVQDKISVNTIFTNTQVVLNGPGSITVANGLQSSTLFYRLIITAEVLGNDLTIFRRVELSDATGITGTLTIWADSSLTLASDTAADIFVSLGAQLNATSDLTATVTLNGGTIELSGTAAPTSGPIVTGSLFADTLDLAFGGGTVKATVLLGGGNDVIDLRSTGFSAKTIEGVYGAGIGSDTIQLADVTVDPNAVVTGGKGADIIEVTPGVFSFAGTVHTGGGDDTFEVA